MTYRLDSDGRYSGETRMENKIGRQEIDDRVGSQRGGLGREKRQGHLPYVDFGGLFPPAQLWDQRASLLL